MELGWEVDNVPETFTIAVPNNMNVTNFDLVAVTGVFIDLEVIWKAGFESGR